MKKTNSVLSGDILLILPVLFLILLVGLGPFGAALEGSVWHETYGERSFAGLENFRIILKDGAFPMSLNITVLWALLNVILSLAGGFLLALALVRSRGRFLYRGLLIPWGVPVYIAIPLWRALLHGNGGDSLLYKLTGLRLNLMIDPVAGFCGALGVSLWLSLPLTAFVLAGHMRKTGRSALEAARLDGASEGQIARFLYLPEIKGSLLAMGVLNFIKAFKEFTVLFMLTSGGPPLIEGITDRHIVGATTTLGVFLYEVFLQNGDWGINSAYALIMAALVLFIMTVWILLRRHKSIPWFLALSALALLPGGTPVDWALAAAYLYFAWRKGKGHWKILFLIHAALALWSLVSRGFLSGFHPEILIPLIALLLDREKQPGRSMGRLGHAATALAPASNILAAVYLTATAVIFYMLIWMSLSRISACYVDSFLPSMATLENFKRIFTEEGIFRYFGNSLILAGSTALLLPLLIFPAAVYLDRIGKKKTLLFLAFLQIIGIAGGMHSLIPLYRIFLALGLIDSFIPLILIYLNHSIPLALLILTAYLRTLPASFRDLARLEGMSPGSYGFRILLPLSLPTLSAGIMTAFISGWNGFQAPLLFLNSEELYPVSLKLHAYVGNLASGSPVWNLFAAASMINTMFIGGLFLRFKHPMERSPASDFQD